MTSNLKTKLLLGAAGAALAFGGFVSDAQAAVVAQTLGGNVTWAVDANQNQSPADGTGAAANDTVDVLTHTLTVLNTTANDGSGVGTYNLGAVTGTTGSLTITSDAANVDLTANVASLTLTGAGNLTVNTLDADDSTVAATITGATTIGGNISVVSTEADAADTVTLTLTGNATVTGTTQLTAGGNFSGANATLNIDGATNVFTGAVTVDGGGNAGADAFITVTGASTTFTGGLALDDNTGQAIATFDGATAQTVAGAITGVSDGDGAILVTNTSGGVTFTGTVGTAANSLASVTVAATNGNNTSATFKAGVDVTAIVLGNGSGTDTNTVTFDGTTAGYTVAGTVNGTAGDTDNVVVTGGNTITTSGIWGGGSPLDSVAVSGNSTLSLGASASATAFTVASGSTLQTSGAATITGTLNGAGTLDVNAATTVAGVIGGTTALTAIDVAAGITLTLNGTTTAATATTTTLSGVGTGVLAFTGGNTSQTFTSNIVTATDNAGGITIANGTGTTAFVGNIGTSTAQLATLAVAGGGDNIVTTTGNLYVNAITLDDADSLRLIGTSAQTVSGTIGGVGDNDGNITVGNGTAASDVTFAGIIGTGGNTVGTATVSANSTARFNANAEFNGAFTNAGTTRVGTGATLTAGSWTDTAGSKVILDVTDTNGTLVAADFGQITAGATAYDTDDISINVTGLLGTANDIDILGAATFDEAKALSDNSALYTFTADAGHNIDVTQNATSSFTNSASNAAVADQLLSIGVAATGELETVQDAFAAADSSTVNKVLEATTSPNLDGGAVAGGLAVANSTAGVTSSRLASLRDGTAGQTGMAAGNVSQGLKAWGQVFGTTGTQDERDGVSGFDVDSVGFAAGVDTEGLAEDWVVGLAFSYADTEVDSDGLANAKTEIDTYQVALYGDYDLDERTYVSGQLGYLWSSNDTTRNPGGVSSITAKGDFDSDQILARVELGRDYMVGTGATLTPKALVNYNNYDADGYTETGAGTANLAVDSDALNVLEIGVGVDASWTYQQASGAYFKPEVSAGIRHDLIGDEVESTNTFQGGGTAFKAQGFDPAQTTMDLGAGVTYFTTDNWELSANYDYEFKSDYDSHSGLVKAAYKF